MSLQFPIVYSIRDNAETIDVGGNGSVVIAGNALYLTREHNGPNEFEMHGGASVHLVSKGQGRMRGRSLRDRGRSLRERGWSVRERGVCYEGEERKREGEEHKGEGRSVRERGI